MLSRAAQCMNIKFMDLDLDGTGAMGNKSGHVCLRKYMALDKDNKIVIM